MKKIFTHLKNGTLFPVLREKQKHYKHNRRKKWWDDHKNNADSFLMKLEPGIRMKLYFQSDMARIIYCADFELLERRFIAAFLKPGDIFVDVGANIGLFTLIAAEHVGPQGNVFSFEPTRKIYNQLLENVTLNEFKNVHCIRKALSDSDDIRPLFVATDGFDDYNSFAKPLTATAFTVEKVTCLTWDSFAAQEDLTGKVAMMKIDVEGWETRVLKGGASFFQHADAPLLQVEFTDEASIAADSSCRRLYHLLEEFGYKIFRYDHRRRDIIPDPLREHYPYVNLIATKKPEEAFARIRSQGYNVFFKRKKHA
ncbi:MAG: FkbM family methyltransferase [Desulfobacteraceae bacterium]|nr:MAG: FkbM family methyltransferase [Desulfobacteraceae bacterium]